MPRVFFITGSSAGIGKELVQVALENGDNVVAAARKPETLNFANATPKNFLAVPIELSDAESVRQGLQTAVSKFGRLDVVVNNGGYGLSGALEDLSDEEIKRQLDVNFIGTLVSTRAAIKIMREQQPSGGVIQNVSSLLGRVGGPWMSLYCASKFAVEGLTEAVAAEVDPKWNIKFTLAEFGGVRTDFFSRSMQYTHPANSAYDLSAIEGTMKHMHAIQNGDPRKGAEAMYKTVTKENPPLRTAFGSDAFEYLDKTYKQAHADLLAGEELSRFCDVDEPVKEELTLNGSNGTNGTNGVH